MCNQRQFCLADLMAMTMSNMPQDTLWLDVHCLGAALQGYLLTVA